MPVQSFFILGPLPDLNDMLWDANQSRWIRSPRSRRLIKVNNFQGKKNTWTRRIQKSLMLYPIVPIYSAYFIFIWMEAKRTRDKDNVSTAKKYVFDALVHAKLMPNDGWRHVLDFSDRFVVNKETQGVWVHMIPPERTDLVSRFFPTITNDNYLILEK